MLLIQPMLTWRVEMELKQFIVLPSEFRIKAATVLRRELDRVAVILNFELPGVGVPQRGVPPSNAGFDIDRRLLGPVGAGVVGYVNVVPEEGSGLPGVGPCS